jgi:hypothetical protein
MMKKKIARLLFLAFILVLSSNGRVLTAQSNNGVNDLKQYAPSVFLDCNRCDRDFLRMEITFVNYVRDRKEADIHLLVTNQSTGGGGMEYTLAFIGLDQFEGQDVTLTYISQKTDTDDDTRRGLADVMKKGFFPYIVNTPLAEFCRIDFREKLEPTAVEDPWDFWVFSMGLDGDVDSEQSRSSYSIDGNFSANRVTPELKIQMSVSGDYDESEYNYDEETILSTQERRNFSALVVKSLSDHWSVGGWLEASRSTYSNIDSQYSFSPALEFNFFPYQESTRRQLRCLYKLGLHSVNYAEETIFFKNSEKLFKQSLAVSLSIREPWGNASTTLEGSQYFHDLQKNRMELWGSLSVRLFRGLSMNFRASYERIRDQLNLPFGDATLDEVLLRRKELATDYEYSLSAGISYTFGSKFSNVVNPRFDGSHRGRH